MFELLWWFDEEVVAANSGTFIDAGGRVFLKTPDSTSGTTPVLLKTRVG